MANANLTEPQLHVGLYVIPFAIGGILISGAGCFGNALIVLAISRYKELQNKCSLLMCALAVSDFLSCLIGINVSLSIFIGQMHITSRKCFYLLSYGLFGLFNENVLMMIVGVDRFLAVRFPIW